MPRLTPTYYIDNGNYHLRCPVCKEFRVVSRSMIYSIRSVSGNTTDKCFRCSMKRDAIEISCPDCGIKRKLSESWQRTRYKSGKYFGYCKECNKKRLSVAGTKNRKKKGSVPWNKGTLDLEKRRLYKKRWKEENMEKVRLYFRNYYWENLERDRLKKIAYRQNRRKAGYVKIEWINNLFETQTSCYLCGGVLINPEVDHIIPVALGGKSTPNNLSLSCRSCNRKKWKRTPEQFAEYLSKKY